jgi:general secretion pathway protein K
MKRDREKGYAMLAAILGIAAFSYIGFEVIAEGRGVVSEVQAENERAKLTAACNAGIQIAVANLASKDKRQQWPIDGLARTIKFDDVTLSIAVEDERGKLPLNGVNEDQIRQLFSAAGIAGPRLDTLVDSFEDWLDPDDDRRPHGAELADYLSQAYKPRNGGFHTVSEIRLIQGMDDDLYARVAPNVTAFFGESGGFSESTSQILALEALSEVGPTSPEVLEREQELAGQKQSPLIASPPLLTGRTLTVRVKASRAGAEIRRSAIIELTGSPADPVWMRYLN